MRSARARGPHHAAAVGARRARPTTWCVREADSEPPFGGPSEQPKRRKAGTRPALQSSLSSNVFGLGCPKTNKAEREKRFELSTSTLARLHSTTELLPRGEAWFRWLGRVCQLRKWAAVTSINVGVDGAAGMGGCARGRGLRQRYGCLKGERRGRSARFRPARPGPRRGPCRARASASSAGSGRPP